MAEVMSEALGLRILGAVQELGSRMDKLEARMDKLEARTDRLEKWMERLGAEFILFREQVRGDLAQWRAEIQEDNRLLKKRVGVTANTVVLMSAVLREPTEFSAELNSHLGELQVS